MTISAEVPTTVAPDRRGLRLAVAAYLARFKGHSRTHVESDLRCFLTWCVDHQLDPLTAQRPHLELYLRWMQEVRRLAPSTVSRRVSIVAGFYCTCDRRSAHRLAGRAWAPAAGADRVDHARSDASAVRGDAVGRPAVGQPVRLRAGAAAARRSVGRSAGPSPTAQPGRSCSTNTARGWTGERAVMLRAGVHASVRNRAY